MRTLHCFTCKIVIYSEKEYGDYFIKKALQKTTVVAASIRKKKPQVIELNKKTVYLTTNTNTMST